MSEAVPNPQQEFWLRPVMASSSVTAASSESLKSCLHCSTEFMAGSRFCYLCGAKRDQMSIPKPWTRHSSFSYIFEFRRLKRALGLSLPSLIAFIMGIGCLVETIRASATFHAATASDFQSLQLVRIEWLLGSIAAF